MIDFTSLENTKSFLNMEAANIANDTELARLITSVSSLIRNWLNRDISLESYSDRVVGNGKDTIISINYPINSIASITIGGQIVPIQNYTYTNAAIVLLNGATFPRNTAVVIDYAAGFATVPYEIEQICIEIVAKKFKSRDRIGISSKGLAGETTSYDLQDMRGEALSLLAAYTKVTPT